ncbi:MAG: M20/M25/M40 family metallo-hydrolase [Chloroflexota bacterium]
MPEPDWRALAERARAQITDFGQRLLRARSLPGQEGDAAQLVLDEMQRLGYDAVSTDAAGNVIGRVAGGSGPTTMLHAHLDVVDPGDASLWRFAPFSGQLAEGYLWGRGASDDKGCVIAQLYAAGLLRQAELRPAGDVHVAAVVNEENGGVGSRYLATQMRPDLIIVGEPSANTLRRGHRGRMEFVVTLHGRSVHASVPARGLNPHFSMARLLLALRDEPMFHEPVFGGTSCAPTLAYVDQTSSNVIPAQMTVHIDWRNAPGETAADATALLQRLLERTVEPGLRAELRLRSHTVRTYTGHEHTVLHEVGSFLVALDDPQFQAARAALSEGMGRPVKVGVWGFCTDGGILHAAGIPCLGYGPGEEHMAHVRDERIAVDQLVEATAGYMALAYRMGGARPR